MWTKFRGLFFISGILAILSACRTGSGDSNLNDKTSNASESLPDGIYPLKGLDPSLPFDDLKPIIDVVRDATVVGLGEAMHTSGGFHRAKVRVIRDLIETQGFRAVAFESNWAAAFPLRDYVSSGTGSALIAVSSIFPQFQSQEVMDLISWSRTFNQSHKDDPVVFFGFDMQEPDIDAARLNAFLGTAVTPSLGPCIAKGANGRIGPTNQAEYDSCFSVLSVIDKYISDHEKELVKATSQQEFELSQVAVIAIRASATNVFKGGRDGLDARDAAMATIFSRLRHTMARDAKAVIWAHSGHVMKRVEKLTFPFETKNMGSFLTDLLSEHYKTIAMTAFTTQISPWWRGEGLPLPSIPTSFEGRLHNFGQDILFVAANNGVITPGQKYNFSLFNGVPAEQFDGFIYLQVSEPMIPIPGITYPAVPHTVPCQPGNAGSDIYTYTSWKCNGKDILAVVHAVGVACFQQVLPKGGSVGTNVIQFAAKGCHSNQATAITYPSATTLNLTLGATSCSSNCTDNECQASPPSAPPENYNYSYSVSGNTLTLTTNVSATNVGNGGLYDLAGCLAGELEEIVASKP